MKFRTMLLASAAVMVASSAFAAEDITSPFYLPAQGKILSDTTLKTSRFKMDNDSVEKGLRAEETVTVGVAENLAVFGRLGNEFNVDKEYNNNHNFDYTLGGKYNWTQDKLMAQVVAGYYTFDPRSWWGKAKNENNKWEKFLFGQVKLGYELDCGLTPYTTFQAVGNIDNGNREMEYSWFLGAHKLIDKTALDLGVRYDFTTEDDYEQEWYAQGAVDYYVRDNVTVGVFGDYYLGGKGHKDVDYGYDLGLSAKVLF